MRVVIPVGVIHFGNSSWCWLSLVKDVEVSALSPETFYVDQKGKEINHEINNEIIRVFECRTACR